MSAPQGLVGVRVRRLRLGLTQGDLAREAGVSQSLVAKIERGQVEVSYRNGVAILEALGRAEDRLARDATAGALATREILRVAPKDKLTEAARQMRAHGVSQLPVLEGDLVVGSLTDRMVVDCLADPVRAARLERLQVKDVMREPFPQVDVATPGPVAALLLRHAAAVLVTERGRCIGILTQADLFRAL